MLYSHMQTWGPYFIQIWDFPQDLFFLSHPVSAFLSSSLHHWHNRTHIQAELLIDCKDALPVETNIWYYIKNLTEDSPHFVCSPFRRILCCANSLLSAVPFLSFHFDALFSLKVQACSKCLWANIVCLQTFLGKTHWHQISIFSTSAGYV